MIKLEVTYTKTKGHHQIFNLKKVAPQGCQYQNSITTPKKFGHTQNTCFFE